MSAAGADELRQRLPFAVDRVEVFAALPERCFAVVRGGDASSGLHKLEIAITDQDGRVCARLSGFSSRMVRRQGEVDGAAADAVARLRLVGDLTLAVTNRVLPAPAGQVWPSQDSASFW